RAMLLLKLQQCLFGGQSTTEPRQLASAADDAVTRNDDGNWIPAIGCAYRSPCLRVSKLAGNLAITASGTIGNAAQSIPYPLLEVGPQRRQRQVEVLEFAGKIGIKLTPDFRKE